jgi:acyl-CoA thioester hydrolase
VPRYTYPCTLRWSDMDAYGHVNNARFLTLFEEARIDLMFIAQKKEMTSLDGAIVVARHEVDYLRPVDFGNEVRIEMWMDDIRRSRFSVLYELFAADVLASRGRTVCVPFDLISGRPRRLTAPELEFLGHWIDHA